MMRKIGIAAIDDPVTTARYLEKAARAAGYTVIVLSDFSDRKLLDSLDCLIVCDPCLALPTALRNLACPVVGYMIDVHRSLAPRLAYARYLDHVFVAQPQYLEDFCQLPHPSVHWLPLACDPEVHFPGSFDRQNDVGFVGKPGRAGSGRRETLDRVLGQFTTNDCTRFYSASEMGEVYSRSKIVFNRSIGRDLNMRFFEGMASGALLVTDCISNGMDQIGQDGEHYVTYRTADEAVDKIRYYLKHDLEREAMARRGQQLVFEHHTYALRLAEILAVVARDARCCAPARIAVASKEAIWRSEHMMMHGAGVLDAAGLLLEGELSPRVARNLAMAVGRGLVRPLRQAISAKMKTRF